MPSTASDASPRAGSPQVTKYPIRPDDGPLRKKPRRAFAPRSDPFAGLARRFASAPPRLSRHNRLQVLPQPPLSQPARAHLCSRKGKGKPARGHTCARQGTQVCPHRGSQRPPKATTTSPPTGTSHPAGGTSPTGAEITPNRSLDRLAVCLTVFLRLYKPFCPATGILDAALSRRSPLRLRQRRLPIDAAAKRNREKENEEKAKEKCGKTHMFDKKSAIFVYRNQTSSIMNTHAPSANGPRQARATQHFLPTCLVALLSLFIGTLPLRADNNEPLKPNLKYGRPSKASRPTSRTRLPQPCACSDGEKRTSSTPTASSW